MTCEFVLTLRFNVTILRGTYADLDLEVAKNESTFLQLRADRLKLRAGVGCDVADECFQALG